MNFWQRFFGHLSTVVKHKHYVFIHCCKAGIPWQGLTHDLSKFSPTEFIPGVRYFQGHRSPNEAEREDNGYSLAWIHHKGINRHHYEHWTDINPKTKEYEPVKMPLRFVKEMFCDRVAASKTYQKGNYNSSHPLEYFARRKDHRELHPETARLLTKLLTMLKEEGEDSTFRYIRSLKDY